jgi:hypothetical protein
METVFELSNAKEANTYYITLFEERPMPELAEVTETPMEGWTLYTCFLYSTATTLFLGWDTNATTPEYIEVNEAEYYDYMPSISQALTKRRQGAC